MGKLRVDTPWSLQRMTGMEDTWTPGRAGRPTSLSYPLNGTVLQQVCPIAWALYSSARVGIAPHGSHRLDRIEILLPSASTASILACLSASFTARPLLLSVVVCSSCSACCSCYLQRREHCIRSNPPVSSASP